MNPEDVRKLLMPVASRHGLYQCERCSIAMAGVLRAGGVHGRRVRLRARSVKWGNIAMRDPGFRLPFACPPGNISTNGDHYGVVVDDAAYCNIFRAGIAWKRWVESFDCVGGMFCVEFVEEF